MADAPLVSIVITHYNYSQFIGECLASTLALTYPKTEVIVVDDGSDNSHYDKMMAVAEQYPCRVISHGENRGYAAAKNTGVLESCGEYIRMFDADDYMLKGGLCALLDVFDKNPAAEFVSGRCLRWYGKKDTRGFNPKTKHHPQGWLYKKTIHDKYGLYYEQLRSMADKEFQYRLGVHPLSPLPQLVVAKRTKNVVALYRKHIVQMHRVRKQKPKRNAEILGVFKRRIADLRRDGITRQNTRFP